VKRLVTVVTTAALVVGIVGCVGGGNNWRWVLHSHC